MQGIKNSSTGKSGVHSESKSSEKMSCFKNRSEEERAGATTRYRNAVELKQDVVAVIYLKFGFCIKINSHPDYVETAKRFQKSAEQHDANAQICLGFMYYFGNGVVQNYTKAAELFQKAADQGDELSQICLGYMFSLGKGVKEDKDEALKLYREAATRDKANIDVLLGDIFYSGIGIKKDCRYAHKLYFDAASQGDVIAMCGLGNICRDNDDQERAFIYYKSAAIRGYGPAMLQIGNIYKKRPFIDVNTTSEKEAAENYRKAADWYGCKAEQGDVVCQNILADMYYDGIGVEEDKDKAIKLYQKAANHGYAKSQYKLGSIYIAQNNISEAKKWFSKSAEQGFTDAQYGLGIILQSENNISEAKKWFQKAAENGHILSKFKLGAIAMRQYNESTKQIKELYCLENSFF